MSRSGTGCCGSRRQTCLKSIQCDRESRSRLTNRGHTRQPLSEGDLYSFRLVDAAVVVEVGTERADAHLLKLAAKIGEELHPNDIFTSVYVYLQLEIYSMCHTRILRRTVYAAPLPASFSPRRGSTAPTCRSNHLLFAWVGRK